MELAEYKNVISAYNTSISDFFISVTSGQVIFATSIFSGHFCDLNKPMCKKINSVIFTLEQAYFSGIISYDNCS